MAGIFFGEAFAFEDMAEMGVTVRAADFDPVAIRIRESFYGARKIIVKSGPATTSIEFRLCIIEWRIAAAAEVRATSKQRIVFARKWNLGPPSDDDARFFGCELVPRHRRWLHYTLRCFFQK